MTGTLTRGEQDALFDALESEVEEVRRLAVEQLVLLPPSQAVPELLRKLGDRAWRVRKAAVERLVACREDSLVHSGLLGALADGENPGRRNAAFEAFVAMGSRATEPLVAAITSPDVDVRKLAIDALAAIGDIGARDVLVPALDDPDANVRAAAADALGVVGGLASVSALIRSSTCASEVPLVRLSALRSLERLEVSVGVDALAEAIAHPQLRPAALDLLGHSTDPRAEEELVKGLACAARSIRESAIGGLLRQLGRRDPEDTNGLCTRLRELSRADEDLVARCCDGLEGEELSRRMSLVQFLGVVGDERAILPLLRAGRDEALRAQVDATLEALGEVSVAALRLAWGELELDLEMRACGILGRVGGESAEELLVATLRGSSWRAVGQAAMALGAGGFFQSMPELVRRLETSARDVDSDRTEEIEDLISAIGRLAECAQSADAIVHAQLIDVLSSRLGGAPEALRVAVARVLGRIGRIEDSDQIDYLARDASPLVRRAAVQALGRFDASRTRQAMRLALGDESSGVRIAAAVVLGHTGTFEALDDLERLSRDGDSRVAAAAVRAAGELLGKLGETAVGAGAWIGLAVARDPIVALAALEALSQIGGPIALEASRRALARSEPEVIHAAIVCIGRHATGDELLPLVALVGNEDWTVRAEAVKVLAARGLRKALPAMLRRLEVEVDSFVREAILAAARKLEQ